MLNGEKPLKIFFFLIAPLIILMSDKGISSKIGTTFNVITQKASGI